MKESKELRLLRAVLVPVVFGAYIGYGSGANHTHFVLTSGVFGGQSLISASYPGIGDPDPRFVSAF